MATGLRHRQHSLSSLIKFIRLVDGASASGSAASFVNCTQGFSDQWHRTFHSSCSERPCTYPQNLHVSPNHRAQPTLVRTFASSAEFSEGSFTVSSSSSDSHDIQQTDTHGEVDDREMLLESALQFVGDKGWTDAALISGAQHIGLSPAAIGLLPRGPAELVEYFEKKCNMELTSILQSSKADWQNMRTTQRVKEGLKMRLQMNVPHIETWAQALSIRAQPRNVPSALEQLAQITDDVWHAAGDKSTDYNWYTKRGLLAGVYTATELYMLTDYSPGFADTWDVLDRRLQDVMTIGRVMGQMGTSAASIVEQISSSLSLYQRSIKDHD